MAGLNDMFDAGNFNWQTDGSNNVATDGNSGGYSVAPWDQGRLSTVDWSKQGWGGPTGNQSQESGEWNINPEFKSWLDQQGYRPGAAMIAPGLADRQQGVLNSRGSLVGSSYLNHINDSQFWTGAMLAAGLASGGAANTAGLGTTATGAVTGATTGFGNSGTLQGTLKGAATGAAGAGLAPDVAGYAGIENPALAAAVNGGTRSGITAGLQGGSGKQIAGSAVSGGVLSGLNTYGTNTNMEYQPNSYNDAIVNDANQASMTRSMPSWYTQDVSNAPGPQSNYVSSNSGFGVNPNTFGNDSFEQDHPIWDNIKNYLGIQNGRVGVGIGGGQGIKFGDLAGGLMQLYQANRAYRQSNSLLGSITGGNGAYSQNLRNQLMAKDAASGRRSNYGGREVQLQSALAQLNSQQAPAIMNLQNQRENGLFSGLQGLYTIGSRGGWLPSGADTQPVQQQQQPYLPSTFQQPNQAPVDYSLPYQKKGGILGGGQ